MPKNGGFGPFPLDSVIGSGWYCPKLLGVILPQGVHYPLKNRYLLAYSRSCYYDFTWKNPWNVLQIPFKIAWINDDMTVATLRLCTNSVLQCGKILKAYKISQYVPKLARNCGFGLFSPGWAMGFARYCTKWLIGKVPNSALQSRKHKGLQN